MSDYTLKLSANNKTIFLPLATKEIDDAFDDYFEKASDEYVYNDYAYYLSVIDEKGESSRIDSIFVNNEIIENSSFLSEKKPLDIFRECFGIIKIEAVVNGISYVTQNIRVAMKEESVNKNILNMIDYIYDNCDDYLYEEHKNSKTEAGIITNPNVSIDSKLSLLSEIYDTYVRMLNSLKNSAQTKYISINKIGDFNELQNVTPNTLNYIVNHPEELQPVNYNSGISINKQYYQPQKTLVKTVGYSHDIYENQVVVGFLKTVIRELEEIKITIENHKKRNTTPYRKDGYIDSAYFIYTRNTKLLNDYLSSIDKSLADIKKLYMEYKKILNVSDLDVISIPRFTNIFRRIMPYNLIFKEIVKWFNCGNYDMSKSDLLLSFVSVSKIYEYFCLLKINCALKKCGYDYVSGFPHKYTESRYYHNTIYNNTFEFKKDLIDVTVYFQPVIYGKNVKREKTNGIGLFRNTTISIQEPHALAILDERDAQHGNYYTPDYLIKISTDEITNYYILDAKHSHPNNIKRYQLPYLVFKYLFSISALLKGTRVAGMCILCGKTSENSTESIYDIAYDLNESITPDALICNVTGCDVDNDNQIIEYIRKIEKSLYNADNF